MAGLLHSCKVNENRELPEAAGAVGNRVDLNFAGNRDDDFWVESRCPPRPFSICRSEHVVAGIDFAARPAAKRLVGLVWDLVPFTKPMALFGDFAPKASGALSERSTAI